ncbi:MAG: hypothetical protein A3K54_04960 [Omnitrophica WOR_2 bacterium RBG_13_44_8]|nr:MAG: hypothetical protein A3K54_04960 [Omnitrophica WOR_2 bacterium RBG_13_44_8]
MAKCAAEPPNICFLVPKGVFTVSRATVPKTTMLINERITYGANILIYSDISYMREFTPDISDVRCMFILT